MTPCCISTCMSTLTSVACLEEKKHATQTVSDPVLDTSLSYPDGQLSGRVSSSHTCPNRHWKLSTLPSCQHSACLPLKKMAKEMIQMIKSPKLEDVRLHSTVFEDNQSTYFLATNQQITSRTKYLLAKWHWFWDQYNQGEFTIVKCPTDKQLADFPTKLPPRHVFEANRKSVSGW